MHGACECVGGADITVHSGTGAPRALAVMVH